MFKCLCQDCGAVLALQSRDELKEADEKNRDGNRLCHCGGDVCGCENCHAEAEAQG